MTDSPAIVHVSEVARDALIRTVWGEARGEGTLGQAAVTYTILHRASAPAWWGDDVWSVCHSASQFSCWNSNDPNCLKMVHLNPKGADYARIAAVVDQVLAGKLADITHGATHYKVTGTGASWDKATVGLLPTIIGHHSFYKLGPSA